MKVLICFLCFPALLFAVIATAHAQPMRLSGRVTDSAGEPLPGANVLEKGTNNGTTADSDGRYELTYSSADAIIVFSFVGFRRQEIRPEGRSTVNVVLEAGLELGDVVVVGSRRSGRSVLETPVAIDVFELEEVTTTTGHLNINRILHHVAPSFNANRQSGADGADHIDPATLRGLGPDQTLVLVNGKRRHQSSHINIFGSRGRGNTGTDLNTIPAAAVERIEILRDGASAQYGSDAIAGIVNIVLKSTVNEFTGDVSTAAHRARFRTDKDWDGESVQVSANYGIPLGGDGFLNLTGDYLSRNRTNRPANPDEYDIYRRQFGDAELENFSVFANGAARLSEDASLYAFGGYSFRDTDAFAWTRDPDSDRNIPSIYPGGFDPHITSDITDRSISFGIRSRLRGWDVDINNTYGANRFHYVIDGTLNASLLERSPTRFDAGGFDFSQNTTGIAFTQYFANPFGSTQGANVAFGVEYRLDSYEIFAGEEGSWRNYGVIDTLINGRIQQVDILGRPGGAQGFPGFRPENELDEARTNVGGYIDAEVDLTDRLLVGGAVRFEEYSDFGSTLNGKLTARFALSEHLAVRSSISSGFRAPSLAQIHFNSTFTDFVAGVPVDKLIARNNSPITRALGIPALKEETAVNGTAGFTLNSSGFSATIDGYLVDINDRIVLTGAFEDTDQTIGDELQAQNVGAAQFFTNALDTRTLGLDVILSFSHFFDAGKLTVSVAGNFNHMEAGGCSLTEIREKGCSPEVNTSARLEGKEDIYFGVREQYFLLASAPGSKLSFAVDWSRGALSANVRLVRFGEVVIRDWIDEEDVYDAKASTDVALRYAVSPNLSFTVGGSNVLNVYPTQQDTETETGGLFDAVQMGFSGSLYYGKLQFKL